jgi:hypothetical protein
VHSLRWYVLSLGTTIKLISERETDIGMLCSKNYKKNNKHYHCNDEIPMHVIGRYGSEGKTIVVRFF